MAYRPYFADSDSGTVIGSTDTLHPNSPFEDILIPNKLSSWRPNEILYRYLQIGDPDAPIHESRKDNPTSRSSMYSNAETQQQNSNPNKTESVSRGPDVLNESNLLEHNQREIFVADALLQLQKWTAKRPVTAMLDSEKSSISPVNQFPTDSPSADVPPNSKTTPILLNAKRPVAATPDSKQSSISPTDSPSADVPPNSKTTPVLLNAKRPAAATSDGERSRKRVKTRISLPLTLNANSGPATVLACPDTGSEENIISLDLAQALGYNILTSPLQNRTFALANGSIVEAVGEIIAECSFGIETAPAAVPMVLVFYVFMKLASPIIMGLAFLEQTSTLSKHRDRLLRVPRPAHLPIQVYSVGRPRNQMHCYLNNLYARATPDSGSEVNLMARSFASKSGFHIENAKEVIEFADGTIAVTSGVVRENLVVGFDAFLIIDFYLMDDLRHDIIVGDDSLEELEIFTKRSYTLFSSSCTSGPAELSRIRHLGAVDHMLSWVKKKISLIRRPHGVSISAQVSSNDSLADQRENDRREREEIRIINLPVDQQEGAIAAEALKQAQYDNTARGP